MVQNSPYLDRLEDASVSQPRTGFILSIALLTISETTATAPPGARGKLNVGVFLAPVIFDFSISALTFFQAVRLWCGGYRATWLQFFVREGAVYFIVVTFLNLGESRCASLTPSVA